MSGFGGTLALRERTRKQIGRRRGRQLCPPSVFTREMIRTTGLDAYSIMESDRYGVIDVRDAPGPELRRRMACQ